MMRTMLTSTMHRARVTHADPDHVGSGTIDEDLLGAAGLPPGEQVAILLQQWPGHLRPARGRIGPARLRLSGNRGARPANPTGI